jgi:hypothetical protein
LRFQRKQAFVVFAYQGFTHDSGKRSFLFHSVEARVPAMAFLIEIDLRLLLQYKISVQDGPSFCLQMLTKASAEGQAHLDKLRSYRVVGEDFRPLVAEREKKEAEKVLRWRAQKQLRVAANLRTPHGKASAAGGKNAV